MTVELHDHETIPSLLRGQFNFSIISLFLKNIAQMENSLHFSVKLKANFNQKNKCIIN